MNSEVPPRIHFLELPFWIASGYHRLAMSANLAPTGIRNLGTITFSPSSISIVVGRMYTGWCLTAA